MTRKDYAAMAASLNYCVPAISSMADIEDGRAEQRIGFNAAVMAVADVFQKDNPRFDRDRFVSAVYGTA